MMNHSWSVLRILVLLAIVGPIQAAYALKIVDKQVILEKLDDYKFCQTKDYNGDICHEALVRWVEKNPADAFKAGKLTRASMNAWNAVHFFDMAFKSKSGNCADEDVKLAVESALDLPSDNPAVKQAQEIGLKLCFKEMKDKILAGASVGSNRLKHVCAVPAAASALPPLKQAKCKDLK